MSEINLANEQKIDPASLREGDIINYPDGGKGFVVNPRKLAVGSSAINAGGQDDFNPYKGTEYEKAFATMTKYNVPSFRAKTFTDLMAEYDDANLTPQRAMSIAEDFFKNDAVAGRIIEIMAQFSIAGMRNQMKDKKIRLFFDSWAKQVGLLAVLNKIFLSYYLYGNVYVMKTLTNDFKMVNNPEKSRNIVDTRNDSNESVQKLTAKLNEVIRIYKEDPKADALKMATIRDYLKNKITAARKNVWSKNMIPGSYTILDPKAITVHGPADFGLSMITYDISQDLRDLIRDPSTTINNLYGAKPYHARHQKAIIANLPADIIRQVKDGQTEIVLDPNLVCRIHRMKMDFETESMPLMTRSFRALRMKNRLRDLDSATVDNFISQLMIFKVGDKDYPADENDISALAGAYRDAVQNKSFTLFWNHTLQVERVKVDTDILDKDKYEVWNDDIKDAFGISPILLGRAEGTSGAVFMSVKGFMENLQSGREDVLEQFIYPEYHGVASAMGYDTYPEVIFDKFKLDDEQSRINVIVKLVQTGILDFESAAEDLGYDWEQVLARHKEQLKYKQDGTLGIIMPNSNEEPAAPGTDKISGGRPGGDGEKGGQPNSRPKNKNANPQKKVIE